MNIFISWSGLLSHRVALKLREWLPSVIQALGRTPPFVSSEDIVSGKRWSFEIKEHLDTSNYGIICLTPQNINSPWVNFEAGCISTAFNASKLTSILVGVTTTDIAKSPLSQFQNVLTTENHILKLCKSINQSLSEPISENLLETSFKAHWKALEDEFKTILLEIEADKKSDKKEVPNAKSEDVLLSLLQRQNEILNLLKTNISSNSPENVLPKEYFMSLLGDLGFFFPVSKTLKSIEMETRRMKKTHRELSSGRQEDALKLIEEVKLELEQSIERLEGLSTDIHKYKRDFSQQNY